jgi:hypothetical protein
MAASGVRFFSGCAMEHMTEQRRFVEELQRELRSAQGSRIARDYENALRLVAQVVFTRSAGFLMEFIQNAEDAGMGSDIDGRLSVHINAERIRISHNARPFTEGDVRAICGIQSSKRPEKGTLGYLGIGFKSVFKVTNRPHIFSGGFQFKFDRDHWSDKTALWRVLPIWVDETPEPIRDGETTFIIPLRDKALYAGLTAELANIGTQLYLFLRWLRAIEVIDEVSGKQWSLENLGEKDGVTTLRRGTSVQRFKFFHAAIQVPDAVGQDELTQEFRANVHEREIAVAFALDEHGSLSPTLAGAMYGGVYSFLPLGEASSGLKFPIQADFLVQPGRDAINYEARWNGWLLSEIAALCKKAIREFMAHERWRYQFLPAFASAGSASEAFKRLFGPALLIPIRQYLESEKVIAAADGSFDIPSRLFRLTESAEAQAGLSAFVPESELGAAFLGDASMRLVHPQLRDGGDGGVCIQEANRWSLLGNPEFLGQKAQLEDAPRWFRNLYNWLQKYPVFSDTAYRRTNRKVIAGYHGFPIVLTHSGKLLEGGKVFVVDLPASDPVIAELAEQVAATKPLLHPGVLSGTATDEERKQIRGFLIGFTGVQVLDAARVCLEAVLPKITVRSAKPSRDDLVRWTRCCQTVLGENIPAFTEIWVVTTDGEIRSAKECMLSSAFAPDDNWEANKRYIPGVFFVSPEYLTDTNPSGLERQRSFFTRCGVKGAPVNGVEVFAMNFAEEELGKIYDVTRIEKHNFGYDLHGRRTSPAETIHVEVKGKTTDENVELTGNETVAAEKYGDSFYLAVVAGIPESPTLYMVQNPAKHGRKEKLTIAPALWKSSPWKPAADDNGNTARSAPAQAPVDLEST